MQAIDVFQFTELPPEIRNKIYRFSLVDNDLISLAQPALTRVSRVIRFECLPVFYGNNAFLLELPVAKNEYNKIETDAWGLFLQSMRALHVTRETGLGHIRRLGVFYSEPIYDDLEIYCRDTWEENEGLTYQEDMQGCLDVVLFMRDKAPELTSGCWGTDKQYRLGNELTDWGNKTEVEEAFDSAQTLTHDCTSSGFESQFDYRPAWDRIESVLVILARDCPLATAWVTLEMEFAYMI